MKRIHVIGRKNHGKTELVIALVAELTQRGLRIGTIKHTHHRHELDTPNKDSHRHRLSGAVAVGILAEQLSAVFLPVASNCGGSERYEQIAPMFSACDLVIVEGGTDTDAAKIEVWRAAIGTDPIANHDPTVLAVITDDTVAVGCPVLPRSDVIGLADWVRRHLLQ